MNSSTLSAAATRLALRPIALLAVIVLSTLTAAADRFKYGDLWFETTSYNTCEVAGLSPYDLSEVTIPELAVNEGKFYTVNGIGNDAFCDRRRLTSIDIPNSVTTIGDRAFWSCSSLTSIDIPNSVTTIGDYAFSDCSSLASIDIPNSVTTIGDYAFRGCSSLTSITIPNSVTTIGYGAFVSCSGLTSINIPNSVTTIGDWAFNGCSSLTDVYNYALTPQVITENVFNNYGTLHVFTESKEAFENAAGWSNFYIVDDLGSCEGITPLTTDNDAITDVYSLDGRRTTSRQHNGVSIVRTADGKTRKVMKN